MSMRYPGGLIATSPVNARYPSGVWTQAQAAPYQAQNVWTRDQFWPNTTLLLQGDGATNGAQNNTFLDSSSNNFTITRNGNTTQGSFTPYEQDGYWSNFFGGSSDYLTLANNAAFDLGTGDCTIEAWIFTNSLAATQAIFSVFPGSGTISGYTLLVNTSGTISMDSWVSGTNQGAAAGNYPISVGSWFHVAYTRSGGTNRIFVNGNLCTLSSNTLTQALNTGGNTPKIGYQGYSGFLYPFNGYISNLRIVKGTAVYTAAFTPSAAPLTAITNTSLLTCQSNRFKDNSTNNFTVTPNGASSVQAFQPFPGATTYSGTVLGGSGYFDGSGDYLTAPDNAAWSFGSGNFTVEAWYYPTGTSSQQIIVGQWSGSTGSTTLSWILFTSNNSSVFLRAAASSDGSGVLFDLVSTSPLILNAWNHVALVRSGNTFQLYLNGAAASSGSTTSSAALFDATNALSIGATSAGTQLATGYISDVRILKGTAQYTGSTYTVPTAPLTAIANTQLLCNFTNAGIFDSAAMNDLETVGNAQVSTSVVKYGTGSMAFDGSGDYLVPNSPATNLSLVLGSGDFTIEMWVYFNGGLGSDIVLYDSRPLSTNGVYPTIYVNSSSQLAYVVSSSDRIVATTAFATGQWYHTAICRSGTSTRMFINGTQTGSTYSDSNNYLNPARRPVIAINGFNETAAPLNGYIDDLRVTRAARYITNFTPPPARMPGQ